MREFFALEKGFDFQFEGNALIPILKSGQQRFLTDDEVSSFATLKQYSTSVKDYLKNPPQEVEEVIGVDIETTGLNIQKDQIRLIAICSDSYEIVTEDLESIRSLLENPMILKVFHNASFDVSFLEFNGYSVVNYTDTIIMRQILMNNRELQSLVKLAKDYLGIQLDKSLQHSKHWNGEITDAHRKYCLQDAKITFQLYRVMFAEILNNYLFPTYRREISALPAIIEMKLNGIHVDMEGWEKQLALISKDVSELKSELEEELQCSNLNSNSQLLGSLKNLGVPLYNVTEKHLAGFTGRFPIVERLLMYKKKQKVISTYGEKLKCFLDDDNRLHGEWSLIGTQTYRMSCSKPNLQGLPKELRPYIKPKENHVFIIADYSTIEMRVLAEIANVSTLIDLLNAGADLHTSTAQAVFKDQSIDKVKRQVGKELNFGLIYGLTPYGLANRINSLQGMKVDEDEAQKFMDAYFEKFPEVKYYQQQQLKSDIITTLGGRYWEERNGLLELKPRQRFNYAIQSSSAEGFKETLSLVMKNKKREWGLIAAIHDEIVLEVPIESANEAKCFLEQQMIEGMSKIVKKVPVVVDSKIAKTWVK
ncbi:DNA polymerase [Turicibacter sanguinis]|jgi:DNA-directed DNA polymerase|uniref:DNA polymerase n=1 Tax=Turicibacter sanguinis TaxID=154288 RepID=UPI00325AC9D5